jgi:hypothetical protein
MCEQYDNSVNQLSALDRASGFRSGRQGLLEILILVGSSQSAVNWHLVVQSF